jgi:peptide/nickel transport system substrate-binding protein
MRKYAAWLAPVVGLSVVLSACSSSKPAANSAQAPAVQPSQQTDSKGKTITIGMWSAPDSFLPITSTTNYATQVSNLIYPTLVVMNDKQGWTGKLADKWEVSPDQTKFTFTLNKNAKWSDGQPITAKDVAYTYGVIAAKDTPSVRRSSIAALKGTSKLGLNEKEGTFDLDGVKAVADDKVEFTVKQAVDVDAFMEKAISLIHILPMHVLEKYTNNLKDLNKSEIAQKPVVTGGPFKFVDYKTDAYIELVRNDQYWLGAPKVEKVFIKLVGQATVAAALEKGDVDFLTGAGTGEVPINDWDRVSTLPNLTPITYTAPSYQYMDINVSRPQFANPKVRQAISTAINKDLIVTRLLKGQGEVMGTPINSISKYYRADLVKANSFNTEKAKQLLTEGGWDFNREVTLLTPTGNVVREQSADIIQANLQAAGMKVKIEKVDFPTRQARGTKGDFDISLVGLAAAFDPDFDRLVTTGAAYNYGKYSNAKMDDLLTKAALTAKFDDRKQTFNEALDLFVSDMPMVPLYAPKALVAANKRVQNLKLGPWGYAFNAQEWDVK